MIQIKKIYFIFPYRGVGGVSLLFLRMAHAVAKKYNYKCIIVDYSDGYMSKRANLDLVEVVHYCDNKKCLIDGNAFVVFQSMNPWSIFPNLIIADNVRALFWNCHPNNLKAELPGFRNLDKNNRSLLSKIINLLLYKYKRNLHSFTLYLSQNRGIVFMDKTCYESTIKNTGAKIELPSFLPIPALAGGKRVVKKNIGTREILSICWVGRIVDFKYFILKRLVDDLSELNSSSTFTLKLFIVGGGDYTRHIKNYTNVTKNLEVKYIEHLEEQDLNNFLINEIDILCAMGTSALEGAKYGIPTILLDMSFKDVSNKYNYRWIYQRDGMTLAEDITDKKLAGNSIMSLMELLEEFKSSYEEVSIKTYNYFSKNHFIDNIAKLFISSLEGSILTWGNLKKTGSLKSGFLYIFFRKIKRMLST